MLWIEAIAVVFGLLAVWFVVRQNIWCWPTGLVQVALYVFIFFQVKLYSDVILHLIYVVLQIYGWVHWLYGGEDRGELPVSRLAGQGLIMWILLTVIGTGVWGSVMARTTDAAVPYGDAFTTVASLIAMWLMARKQLENWHFWIAVDVVAIGIYLYKDLYLTSGLYVAFLVLSVVGLISWRRTLDEPGGSGSPPDWG